MVLIETIPDFHDRHWVPLKVKIRKMNTLKRSWDEKIGRVINQE